MQVSDLDFDLPPELIAQTPVSPRDASRLLVVHRAEGRIVHGVFSEIDRFLKPGDILVVNDTKVAPVRLLGRKPTGGKAELLLVRGEGQEWEVLAKGLAQGRVLFDGASCEAVVRPGPDGTTRARFTRPAAEVVRAIGRVPLPPYIQREDGPEDRERYQTVYARNEGAVAAPTAGLHFTGSLLARLDEQGIAVASITLHVGPGTFRPIRTRAVAEHRMDGERYEISARTAERIAAARQNGGRVIAVGTTVTRTLETAAETRPENLAGAGWADLFIYPGYPFRIVDGIVTNFHLPRSTPLFLAAAFAGTETTRRAYGEAIAAGYRFYSYGDAMVIL